MKNLVPMLAHRDSVVRERVVYRFVNQRSLLEKVERRKIVDNCLFAIMHFGIPQNLFLLDLLSEFSLSRVQLKKFCDEVGKSNFFTQKSKKIFSTLSLERETERFIEKVLLSQPPESIFSLPFDLSNDFFEKYYVEQKKKLFTKQLKSTLYGNKNSDENINRKVWLLLKDKFLHANTKEFLNSHYFSLLIGLMEGNFTDEQRSEVRQFFIDLSLNDKLEQRKAMFYLRCIEMLRLKDLADEIFNLFSMKTSKKLYLQAVETLAVFRSRDHAEKIFELYLKKDTTPSLKSALISFFTFNKCTYEEEYLLKLALQEGNPRRQLEIAIALSSLFSTHFIPYALSLLEKRRDYHLFDLEEEILIFSLISDRETIETKRFRTFAHGYFQRRTQRSFQPRLPFFIRKGFKQLW